MSRAALALAVLLLVPASVQAQGTASLYGRSCEAGDLVNCTVMGLIYETGAAGERDRARAAELYQRACDREVIAACRRLELAEEGATAPGPDDELVRVGYIADAYDGSPLGGAIVVIRGIAGIGDHRYIADQAGRVQLDPLPRGHHAVEVRRGGYQLTDGQIPIPWDNDFLILMERSSRQEEVDETVGGIFGQITEEGTDQGIADVDIVVTAGGRVRTLSNGEGRFLLTDLEPGPVVVELQRLGYQPRVVTVNIEAGRTMQIYATMAADPIELEPVEVTVGSPYLERSGFYRRAQGVAGTRFTYRDIARLNAVTVGDVMRRVAGVTVVSSPLGVGSEAISNRRRTGNATGECHLAPYFNGVPTVSFDLEIVPPEEIEALEVYQGASVPIQYLDQIQPIGATCGVVLIWTRDPRRPL